jgi:ABC-type uncharacterized transport system fused permease/ATPase subunit
MAEDISTFTQRSLYFLLIIVSSSLQLVAFSTVLWSISHELVYFLVFYATAGTCIVVFVFGQRLMSLNFNQLRREADFRFSLVRVRENAESIAFYRGEELELGQVKRRFAQPSTTSSAWYAASSGSTCSSRAISCSPWSFPAPSSPTRCCPAKWRSAAPCRPPALLPPSLAPFR